MIPFGLRLFLFFLAFTVQVRVVQAAEFTLPAEEPKDCVKSKAIPCAVTTGDTPRMIVWEENRWELDRNIVINIEKPGTWNLYQGLLVIESQTATTVHTPFADVQLNKSKVMIHLLENKVRVLSLNGEGVRVKQKGGGEDQFLVPGFQNWYGGMEDSKASLGVATVIDFQQFAKQRSVFFMNHQLGIKGELNEVASRVKWAARMAANMYRDLIERKLASYDHTSADAVRREQEKIELNKYLRKLFLKKVNYDY